jgi:hypothetical protein
MNNSTAQQTEEQSPGPHYNHQLNEQINNNFQYHTPKTGQPELYQDLRAKAKELAVLINNQVPNGREKSLALTKLEESVMWANAGIARS